MTYSRPSWDDYFLEVMNAIAKRATCDRGRAGSVAVRDNQILATGYVGSPCGFPHCDDVGHDLRKVLHDDGSITQHCMRTVHSEQNLICQAAKEGISLKGSTIYTRMTPCRACAMLLINSGVKRIVCEKKYHTGVESEEMFKKAGIEIEFKSNEEQDYPNK
ncbi:MAG TPA: cytidine/deoxycytidylate deaminase family protein [Candidatus Woesebacteria bacterium]|nr:cytidine/deoxycytidylate deaminase family protein [Candidatus Woesebacteria bacterium]